MKKGTFILCTALLIIFQISAHAQIQRGVLGDYDTENFPSVSFIWSTPDPDILTPSQFTIIEDDKRLDFTVTVLPPDYTDIPDANILFLVEDMASHTGQMAFAKKLLHRFFTETGFNKSDKFNIATFNRKEYSTDILNFLSPSFTNDIETLERLMADYEGSNKYYKDYPRHTDLYLAINEGIEKLRSLPDDNFGAIFVITAGLNIKASGASTEMETVRRKSLDSGVPVYTITFPIYGDAPEMSILATDTYGLNCIAETADEAINNLKNYYRNIDKRIYGQHYEITFESLSERDGEAHSINLFVDKVHQAIPQYFAPKMTLGIWIKEHIVLSIALILIISAAIGIAVWLLIRNKNKNKAAFVGISKKLSDIEKDKKRLEKEKEEHDRQRAQEIERAKEQDLLKLMQLKNLYPRLDCTDNDNKFIHYISQVKTKIGRDNDNDLIFKSITVSRHHAEITFNGEGFEITDKKSTNKVIVNGNFIDRKTLANGDIIGLGEAVIIFYC